MIPTRRQGFQRSLESAFVVELIALEGPGCPATRARGKGRPATWSVPTGRANSIHVQKVPCELGRPYLSTPAKTKLKMQQEKAEMISGL